MLAICLDDLVDHCFSVSPEVLQKGVNTANVGKHGITKDIVPLGSHNPHISQKGNSHSRKCTVVVLEKLSGELKSKLLKGNVAYDYSHSNNKHVISHW